MLVGVAVLLAAGQVVADTPAQTLGNAWKAYENGDYPRARDLASKIPQGALRNEDYRLYVLAQSHALEGDCVRALGVYRSLAKRKRSRFATSASWRVSDCLWQRGQRKRASEMYRRLLARSGKIRDRRIDLPLAKYRIAIAEAKASKKRAVSALRRFLVEHPLHPMADRARTKIRKLGGETRLSVDGLLEQARRLTAAKKWHESIAVLEQIGKGASAKQRRLRDYWIAMTLFKMRRQYARAGKIFLGLYKQMGAEAPRALFHGARALSRADHDKEAIGWYQRVVAEYPRSRWAPEAQYLSGWLEFNMGNYALAIPHLKRMTKLYPRSRWTRLSGWFLGMSYFLKGDYALAEPYLEKLAKGSGRLKAGKGRYWLARTRQKMGKTMSAISGYRNLIGAYPFSWYALLAGARLKELGKAIGPFGPQPKSSSAAPMLATSDLSKLAGDELIRDADELLRAGLGNFASYELRRGEKAFIKRHGREKGLAMLMDRYRKAGNYNRPWMMAVVYGGTRALNAPPKGRARPWWEHAYPRAFEQWVERHRGQGKSPRHWLHSIMRKESGFDPGVHSYADARGLLQMIPATTRKVTEALGIGYSADLLFDPEQNIKTGSWYIGRLFHKFRGQAPMAAGSFNSGPRPVMRWLDKNKGLPTDEWVELVSYTQTREYMKKVTETYARYQYLYDDVVYEQPLTVNSDYVRDALTY